MPDLPPDIFCYVAVVMPDFSKRQDHESADGTRTIGGFASEVVELYPRENPSVEFPLGVSAFCTPEGVNFKTEQEAPLTHYFELTDIEAQPLHGYCRTYWYLATPEQIEAATPALAERGEPAPSPQMYLPGCLVILSRFPYHTRFAQLLAAADDRAAFTPATLPSVARDLHALCCPAPMPGKDVRLTFGKHEVVFPQPTYEQLPLADTTYLTMISRLSPRNIVGVFNAMLNERHIIFVADSRAAVSSAIADFRSLLYPMTWPHVYIPLLPCHIVEMVDAPMPYICGITRTTLEAIPQSSLKEHVVVDLDSNTVTIPKIPGEEYRDLPPRYVLRLCAVLHGKIHPYCMLHPDWHDDTPTTFKDVVSTGQDQERHKIVPSASVKTLDTLFSSNSEWDFDLDFRRDATSEEAKHILAQLACEAGQKLEEIEDIIPDANEIVQSEEKRQEIVMAAQFAASPGGPQLEIVEDSYTEYESGDDGDSDFEDGEEAGYTDDDDDDESEKESGAKASGSGEAAATPQVQAVAVQPRATEAQSEARAASGRAALSSPFFAAAHLPSSADVGAIPDLLTRGAINPVAIGRGFMSVFTSMLKSFWSLVRIDAAEQSGDVSSLFNKAGLVELSKADSAEYVRHFLETQLFAYFIQTRVTGTGDAHSASLVLGVHMGGQNDFFDAAVITALNRKQGQRKQRLVASLATNAYRRCRRHPKKWTFRHLELPPETPGQSFTIKWTTLTAKDKQGDMQILLTAKQQNKLDEISFDMPHIRPRASDETHESYVKRQRDFNKAHVARLPIELPKGSRVELPMGDNLVGAYPTEYPLIVHGPDGNDVIEISFLTSRDRRLWLGAIKARISDADVAQRVVVDRQTLVFKQIMQSRAEILQKSASALREALGAK